MALLGKPVVAQALNLNTSTSITISVVSLYRDCSTPYMPVHNSLANKMDM